MKDIRLHYDPSMAGFALYIDEIRGDKCYSAAPIQLIMDERSMFESDRPCLRIPGKKEMFQGLFDDLWQMGLRPSARSDEYKAQLASVTDHLNDMRALIFKKDNKREDLRI